MTETAIQLPAGYREASASARAHFERVVQDPDTAWSIYDVSSFADGCTVHWRTNDNRDHGTPTEYADDTFSMHADSAGSTINGGPTALGRALHFCGGGSRYGVGQVVLVYVNGRLVEKVG
jgi:hypothetical protein